MNILERFLPKDPSRLDRIEALLALIGERQSQFQSQIEQTRDLLQSNTRAIQSNARTIRETSNLHRELIQKMVRDREEWRLQRTTLLETIQRLSDTVDRFIVFHQGDSSNQQSEP